MPNYYFPPKTLEEEEPVPGFGNMPSKYMVIMQAPELNKLARKDELLVPNRLKMFFILSKQWGSLYLTSLTKTRHKIRDKKILVAELRTWLPILYREINLVKPERILIMGDSACKALVPNLKNLREDHGSLFTVEAGTDPNIHHSVVMVPTFWFGDIERDPLRKTMFINDLKRFHQTEVTKPVWEVVEDISQIPLPESDMVTIDTETDGLDLNSQVKMIGVGYKNGDGFKTYISHDPKPTQLKILSTRINNRGCALRLHNGPFDLAQLRNHAKRGGVDWEWPRRRIRDTMVNAHLSGELVKNLKHLTSMYTDLPGPHSGGGIEDEQYLAEDVRSTDALSSVPAINKAFGSYAEGLYNDLIPILVDMRLRGVYIDRDKILEILIEKEAQLISVTNKLHELAPESQNLNWNSPSQVSNFFLQYGFPLTKKTKAGALSVSEPILLELKEKMDEDEEKWSKQLELMALVLEFRSLSKLTSGFLKGYLELLDDDNLVYPNLKLMGTQTGRLSCADPNLQQVPRVGPIKLAFKPRFDGYYGLVDFAGAELRLAAIISGDERMAELILSGDPHSMMARLAFPHIIPEDASVEEIKETYAYHRKASKSTTFAMLYGGSIDGIAVKNGLPRENIQAVDDALRANCPKLMNWLDRKKAHSVRTLQTDTMFGNYRNLEKKLVFEGKGGVERAGINTPIQGAAGILALIVLRKLHQLCRESGIKSRPIFGVHDSILSEIAKGEVEIYAKLVQKAYLAINDSPIADYPVYKMLPVEGDLEIGKNWANVESTNENVDILYTFPCSSALL